MRDSFFTLCLLVSWFPNCLIRFFHFIFPLITTHIQPLLPFDVPANLSSISLYHSQFLLVPACLFVLQFPDSTRPSFCSTESADPRLQRQHSRYLRLVSTLKTKLYLIIPPKDGFFLNIYLLFSSSYS